MRISTQLRYGLRAMVDLAENEIKGPVLAKSIAERQGLSKKYLDNLLGALKNAGLVRSIRGAKGGYHLARPASRITVEDIATALEGPPCLVDCVADPEVCKRVSRCWANDFWRDLSEMLVKFMRNTTLADLVRKSREKREPGARMYYI